MSQQEVGLSRRVAVYCEEPSAGLVACMLALRARGDRVVTATGDQTGCDDGLLHLIGRMIEGEFDAVVALPSAVRLDLSRLRA